MTEQEVVGSLDHPIAQLIRSLLSSKETRRSFGQIIIDDEENILQAINANISLQMILTTDIDELSERLLSAVPKNVKIITLSKRTGKKLFGGEKMSRNFAIAQMPEQQFIETSFLPPKDIIVLDKLSISGNIGAIIRTAVALNASAIVLPDTDYADLYDRRIIRASRGFVFRIPTFTTPTSQLINFFQKQSIQILVTTSYAAESIETVADMPQRLAIVFGGEKEGCSASWDQVATTKAKIPICPDVESLNVSAAASIILYLRMRSNL